MTPLQKDLLLHFMPAWSRRIGLSAQLGPEHVTPPAAGLNCNALEQCGALSLDALYVAASDAPHNPRAAVPVFAKLDSGGVLILETRAGRSMKRALTEIGTGNGLDLIFFGGAESLRFVDPAQPDHTQRGRRGVYSGGRGAAPYVAVFQKPLTAAHDTDRKRVSVCLPAPELKLAAVRARILAWRDFLLQSGLTATGELLLVSDGPSASVELQEFVTSELRDLRRVEALRVAQHYRAFGAARAVQTAALSARGDYLFWEDLRVPEKYQTFPNFAMPCADLFSCLGAMWAFEERRGAVPPYRATTILPKPIRSNQRTGRRESLPNKNATPRAALFNKSAVHALAAMPATHIAKRLFTHSGPKKIAPGGQTGTCVVRVESTHVVAGDAIPRLTGPNA